MALRKIESIQGTKQGVAVQPLPVISELVSDNPESWHAIAAVHRMELRQDCAKCPFITWSECRKARQSPAGLSIIVV
jgi:hypothetical protein